MENKAQNDVTKHRKKEMDTAISWRVSHKHRYSCSGIICTANNKSDIASPDWLGEILLFLPRKETHIQTTWTLLGMGGEQGDIYIR